MSQEVLHMYKRSWKTTLRPIRKFLPITPGMKYGKANAGKSCFSGTYQAKV